MIRAYCNTKEQFQFLRAVGLTARQIYREGFGGETLRHCIMSFRDRAGVLFIPLPIDEFRFGNIRVVGFCADIISEGMEIIRAIAAAKRLRALVAALQ